MRYSFYSLIAVLGMGLLALPALAQPTYDADVTCATSPGSGANAVQMGHIDWPADDPVWSFDFMSPGFSSGNRASGLEIRNVTYKGRLVLRRGHVPILNVEYDGGASCSCYRDWNYEEANYGTDGIRAAPEACFADASAGAVTTTCELPAGGDAGSFRGIAAEEFEGPGGVRELVLTGHMRAGWYRYRMKWHFYSDGRVWPEYSFAAADAVCTNAAHRHHAYWRLDFDLDGTGSDVVREINPTTSTEYDFTTEEQRTWGDAADGIYWTVKDATSGFGYEIVPSAADLMLPIDSFSKFDFAVAQYRATELDDGATSLGQCPINFTNGYNGTTPVINGESVADTDVVVWYRSSALHTGGNPWECDIAGPMMTPFGLTSTGTQDPPTTAMPDGYILDRAYPNPFNPSTTVRFKVAQAQDVTLALYDALGRQVAILFDGYTEADRYETVTVEGASLPSGTYTVRLEGETVNGSTRIVLIK